jgi:hypothetical protein
MRMHLEGVKNVLPVPAPGTIVLEPTLTNTVPTADEVVAIAAMASQDVAA